MIPATESRRILQKICGKVTVSDRKTSEISGKWKQYSSRNFLRFFSVDSCQLPVLSGSNRSEIIGKNPKKFRLEYCFQNSPEIHWIRPFSAVHLCRGCLI